MHEDPDAGGGDPDGDRRQRPPRHAAAGEPDQDARTGAGKRQSEREDFIRVGKTAVERAAAQVEKPLTDISWRPAFDKFNVTSEDELFELCGRGKIPVARVVEALFPGLKLPMALSLDTLTRIKDGVGGLAFVRGTALREGSSVFFSRCCRPVPGDRIVGIIEPDGVHVHSIECETLEALDEEKDRWIDLHWTLNAEKNTLSIARLRVNMQNKPGVLGQACTLIGEARGNIVNIAISARPLDYLDIDFDIEVLDARHIINIAAALRTSPLIESVERVRGDEPADVLA